MADEYGAPTHKSAQDALDALNTLRPQAAEANAQLLSLKGKFALGWSALAIADDADFKALGALQTEFAQKSINAALQIAWHIEAKSQKLKDLPNDVPGLFILGLGKLGGFDLNFSSDVDLIAYYDPETLPISENLGQGYVVNKVLKTLSQILKPRHSADFIWRVDWRLRPEASATQLAMPIDMAQDFYFFRAQPWHRLALMKARVIAGDIAAGESFLNTITPFIWRQNLDFRALDELAHLKSRINLEHPALKHQRAARETITEELSGFNVKLGSGGIREIEFIANAQQLIWGGKQYELRTSNTLEALTHLSALGHLPAQISEKLQTSYVDLRRLENAIQMLENQQTHIVPSSDISQQNILTLLGYKDWADLSQAIENTRRFVNAEFVKIFEAQESRIETPNDTENAFETDLSSLPTVPNEIARSWLNGFDNLRIGQENNIKFQSLGRRLLETIFKSSADTELAIGHVNDFLSALSRSEQYLHLLSRNKGLLDSLIPPLLHSPHMSVLLQQSPHIIDIFLSPQTQMSTEFIFRSEDYETRLERLRRFVNENLFIHYTRFMSEGGTAKACHQSLTKLADMTMEAALQIVADDLGLKSLHMTVLGLGKMGTSRMSPLSDLDLIFIFEDGTDPDIAQKAVRRLRTVLTAKLSEGIAYELDMRLRPSGRSGPAAVMLSSFEDHHNTRAYNWEHIALAHSRIVAGDKTLGEKVIAIRDTVLARPRDTSQFLADALTMWRRISDQRISDTPKALFNSKLRTGGLMHAEYSEACNIILGKGSAHLSAPIAFWSHLQLWERLLGQTDKPISELPRFYRENVLSQFSVKNLKEIETRQEEMSRGVIAAFEATFTDAINTDTLEENHDEARIIWTEP